MNTHTEDKSHRTKTTKDEARVCRPSEGTHAVGEDWQGRPAPQDPNQSPQVPKPMDPEPLILKILNVTEMSVKWGHPRTSVNSGDPM